jgi:hypothetical protein
MLGRNIIITVNNRLRNISEKSRHVVKKNARDEDGANRLSEYLNQENIMDQTANSKERRRVHLICFPRVQHYQH